jgi:hypothetical protein
MRYSLWLGKDHLLSVSGTGYSEEYKRFYYGDIQAIIARVTPRYKVLNAVTALMGGSFAALFTALGVTTDGSGSFVAAAILGGTFLFCLLLNLVLGPTCTCHLLTMVHKEQLHSLGRLRAARKAIEVLSPLISQAQGGELTAEEVQARAETTVPSSGRDLRTPRAGAGAPQPKVHYSGRAHEVLFLLLLLDAGLTCVQFAYNNMVTSVFSMALFIGVFACVIVALIRQRGSDITRELRVVVWTTLAYLCVFTYIGQVYGQSIAFSNPGAYSNPWELTGAVASMSPQEDPFLLVMLVVSLLFSLFLGVLGLVFLRDFRRIHAVPAVGEAAAVEEE